MSRELGSVPTWAKVATFLLSLIGLGISIYLTFTHFAGVKYLACSSTGTVDCAAVTTSPQSYFLHIPVAVLGLAQYTVMVALCSPWAWRSTRYPLHVARVALAAVGMAFVLWLLAAELLIIDHICLWCSGVHVVTLALLLILTSVAPTQLG
ncbi:MAG TPA: vitamin K epoxide reductase family protein [Acidimicrobiales bacterium]|nr:vitamin K epoxide reductase family protein [Acidimicrobiales bacterium]